MHVDLEIKVAFSISDSFWVGLSSDLVIEQALMRSVETTGGPTRGRGITEIQRLVWLLSCHSRLKSIPQYNVLLK